MVTLSALRVLANSDRRVFAEAIKSYGLKVIGLRNNDPLATKIQVESVSAIASTLSEDIDDPVGLSKKAEKAMQIAEEYGYIVKILEGTGLPEEEDFEAGSTTTAPVAPPQRAKPGRRPGPEPKPNRNPKRKPFNPPRPAKDPAPKACGGM